MSQPVFIPPQDPYLDVCQPAAADLFSEGKINSYGRWYASANLTTYSTNRVSLELDQTKAVCRNYALHFFRGSNFPTEETTTDSMFFVFDKVQDLSNLRKISFAWLAYDRKTDGPFWTIDILAGASVVSFKDVNGIAVYTAPFQHSTTIRDKTSFVIKEFSKSDFSGSLAFDWTKVKEITFYLGLNGHWGGDVNGYDLWIDLGPYVVVENQLATLSIMAETTDGSPITHGKNAQLVNPDGAGEPIPLPWGAGGYGLSLGNWTVTILDTDFVRWKEDNSTDPIKVIPVVSGANITWTAVFKSGYTGGNDDNGGIDYMPLIALAGAGVLSAGAFLLLRKKGK